jgi:hypothetical protein
VLRPLDLVVLLKLSLAEGRPPYLQLAHDLFLYPSEVYSSVKRSRASQLLQGRELGDRLNRSAFLDFLLHGVRYAFPPVRGTLTRGVPTAYAAPPLSLSIAPGDDPPPVWPLSTGQVRGLSFSPLHKNVPRAALADTRLYELLALVDALRGGGARERVLAASELSKRIRKGESGQAES